MIGFTLVFKETEETECNTENITIFASHMSFCICEIFQHNFLKIMFTKILFQDHLMDTWLSLFAIVSIRGIY